MATSSQDHRFTHLHVHTEYSILDGISRIPELVARTGELGMDSLAITDHGTFYGVVDFYSACKQAGIKPIIGCEVYMAHGSRFDKQGAERSPYHLVLLARDNTGYRNLMRLVTQAQIEGFHYRPRIDSALLEECSQGLIALSGCPSSEVPRLLANGDNQGAARVAARYKQLFGDGYFLELQRHEQVPQLAQINQGLLAIGRELDIPFVATNDAHYVRQGDAPLQDVYVCIQTNATVNDTHRMHMEDDSYYIKSPAEMAQLFPEFPQALANTGLVADMCNVELDFDQVHLPKYPTPDGMAADEYLARLCWEGFNRRYPRPTPLAEERLRYELEVIQHTSFANYFLVVWDIIDFVRRQGIMYGVRGSAAGSVALYCLGITNVDPLEYRLVFERFLNLERKEMPDIDLDFQDDRRDEVLHYVIDRYGSDRVAQIITFGTMGAKAALRDVGRALGMTYGDVDRVARMVPFKARTLEDALRVNAEFRDRYQEAGDVKKLVDTAQGLEGIVHHVSTHAAGVLIADEPLAETVPLQRPVRGQDDSPVLMTQFSMGPVAQLGLLKMDFLGLTNLTILDRAIKLLDESQGIHIDLDRLPLDDASTFELLSSGNTTDLFQLESAGMQRYIKELKPSSLSDISAMIALYRPGPMENIDTFIDAKFGRVPITYPHPSLKELLDETYGIIVYQDQVLLILQQFAGYSLGSADIVRKAMGKKIPTLMAQERDRFVEGARNNGFDEKVAVDIFNLIEPFAGYAFNKAHSVSYALISYWTAYFKAHYPQEYMVSVLNSRMDNPDKVVSSITECFRMGIQVLPPDINKSNEHFIIEKDNGSSGLRTGLAAIKTVGEAAVKPLVEERAGDGPYKSIDDFCRRADPRSLNRRTLESLVRAGAFDSLAPRGAVLEALDQIIATAQREAAARSSGQTSMFGGQNDQASSAEVPGIPLNGPDVSVHQKAAWERDLLGVPLSHNPLKDLAGLDPKGALTSLDQLDESMEGQSLSLLGQVTAIDERHTREQKRFLLVTLSLLSGPMEIIVWPDVLARTEHVWSEGKLLRIAGKLRLRADQFSLACDQVEEYSLAETTPANGVASPATNGHAYARSNGSNGNGTRQKRSNAQSSPAAAAGGVPPPPPYSNGKSHRVVFLGVTESDDAAGDGQLLREVIGVLLEHPGADRVNLEIHTGERMVVMDLPVVSTGYSEGLHQRLESLLGPDTVRLHDGPG